MNKRDLVRDMRECVGGGGVITKNQLSQYIRKSRHKKKESSDDIELYLEGLRYLPDGRGRKYFIVEVAERIMDCTMKS